MKLVNIFNITLIAFFTPVIFVTQSLASNYRCVQDGQLNINANSFRLAGGSDPTVTYFTTYSLYEFDKNLGRRYVSLSSCSAAALQMAVDDRVAQKSEAAQTAQNNVEPKSSRDAHAVDRQLELQRLSTGPAIALFQTSNLQKICVEKYRHFTLSENTKIEILDPTVRKIGYYGNEVVLVKFTKIQEGRRKVCEGYFYRDQLLQSENIPADTKSTICRVNSETFQPSQPSHLKIQSLLKLGNDPYRIDQGKDIDSGDLFEFLGGQDEDHESDPVINVRLFKTQSHFLAGFPDRAKNGDIGWIKRRNVSCNKSKIFEYGTFVR